MAQVPGLNPIQQILPPGRDPATLSYPPMLAVEIALREKPVPDVCTSYGLDATDWDRLRQDLMFIEDLSHWLKELRKEGMSFKIKAQLQSIELLKTSWAMIHDQTDNTPPTVKADLLKFTVRAAGLDGSKDQAATAAAVANALQINILFGDR